MVDNQLIGLYGGAFDPIHKAHIAIAQNCIKKIGLNKVIFIPTGNSPKNKILDDYYHRLEMLNIVCKKSLSLGEDIRLRSEDRPKRKIKRKNTLKKVKLSIKIKMQKKDKNIPPDRGIILFPANL